MPQFQRQKSGQAKVRVLSVDATHAYMLLMRHTGGKMQVLPGDVYVCDEKSVEMLRENKIQFEEIKEGEKRGEQ